MNEIITHDHIILDGTYFEIKKHNNNNNIPALYKHCKRVKSLVSGLFTITHLHLSFILIHTTIRLVSLRTLTCCATTTTNNYCL